MAPVPFIHPVRYPPVVLAIGYLASIPYLTYAVGDSLYTSYKSLGPVSSTRSRTNQRRRFVPVFLGLSITALLVATYYSIKSATLSYKTWAFEHGLDSTQRLLGEDGNYTTNSKNSTETHIANWLSDTLIYNDALEIVAERARRFWWGQQIDLGTTAFSLTLATEGRRRKIPLLTAFLGLAHLVNLSFAHNLFFLALLLTPSPLTSVNGHLELPVPPLPRSTWARLRDGLVLPKPNGWVPDARLFYVAITLSFGLTLFLPYMAGTPTFTKVALLARASTFLPVLLPKIVPAHWGTVQKHTHVAQESLAKLFKFLSAAAFVLHAKISLVALVSNAPNSHYHRHSVLFPWDIKERSRWERSTTALGKVLGSTSDHPAVGAVGWDVLLSALSLGLWAAVRAISARDMLNSSVPSYNSKLSTFERASTKENDLRDEIEPGEAEESSPENGKHDHGMTLRHRRRGKDTQPRGASIASSASEEAQVPNTPSTRQRGRPRKSKKPDNDTDDDTPLPKPQRPIKREADADKAYVPSPAVARSVLEGDEIPPQTLDWESASLAWGLAALGGLACACAGVFGGECVSL
ncbi:hypothetical protein F4859DRAFT_475175 [Xylaria cf. heliscus]|nr:hypothetical protein F4859DRAFT_475175 [Xylaria cf. heliscus]